MNKLFVFLCVLCFGITQVSAADVSGFERRFELVKDQDGHVKALKMRLFSAGFRVAPYVQQIVQDLRDQVKRMQNKADFRTQLDNWEDELLEGNEKNQELYENVRTARFALEALDDKTLEESVAKLWDHGVLAKFEKDMQDVFLLFSLNVVANTDDSQFFYKRLVTYEVVKKALEMAQRVFANVPALSIVSTIIVRVHDMVLEQRLFHQNMLLHYLENFNEKELGLTKSEADHIFSSIYESRLTLLNFRESREAKERWDRFGTDRFFTMVRSANTRLRNMSSTYDDVNERLNFGYVDVVEKGERVIKDLLNKKHKFSSKLSTAYYYNAPNKVRQTRGLIQLAQFALGFVTIPDFFKGQVNSFLDSMYISQQRMEGALVGHFESHNNRQMQEQIQSQVLNPYLIH